MSADEDVAGSSRRRRGHLPVGSVDLEIGDAHVVGGRGVLVLLFEALAGPLDLFGLRVGPRLEDRRRRNGTRRGIRSVVRRREPFVEVRDRRGQPMGASSEVYGELDAL